MASSESHRKVKGLIYFRLMENSKTLTKVMENTWDVANCLFPRRFRGVEMVLENGPPIGWNMVGFCKSCQKLWLSCLFKTCQKSESALDLAKVMENTDLA